MTKYKHLNLNERYQLEALLGQSIHPAAIARQLGRYRSTIEGEIARGSQEKGHYCAEAASTSSAERTRHSRNARTLSTEVLQCVEARLRLELSPEQVCRRLDAERGIKVSHESIYLQIYRQAHKHGRDIAQLRRSRKKRKRRCTPYCSTAQPARSDSAPSQHRAALRGG